MQSQLRESSQYVSVLPYAEFYAISTWLLLIPNLVHLQLIWLSLNEI